MDNNPSRPQWPERYPNLTRRGLLRAGGLGLTGAGAALLFGCGDDEKPNDGPIGNGPSETTRIRFFESAGWSCASPLYLARKYLGDEGLTDPDYSTSQDDFDRKVADGKIDLDVLFSTDLVRFMDAGAPLVALAGVHVGCTEIFARGGIETIGDLKGRKIGYAKEIGSTFASSILRFVGAPSDEQTLVEYPADELVAALARGEIDAAAAVPPFTEQLRASNAHVVLSSSRDRPWTQYYCCMIYGNRDFVRKNPNATKRAVRAILRATDSITRDPEEAARYLVDHQNVASYDEALATFKHLNYNVWRTYNPEETMRFSALRMKESGDIKKTPDQIIKKNTDWRFYNELKREMPMAFAPSSSRFGLDCAIEPVERA